MERMATTLLWVQELKAWLMKFWLEIDLYLSDDDVTQQQQQQQKQQRG